MYFIQIKRNIVTLMATEDKVISAAKVVSPKEEK